MDPTPSADSAGNSGDVHGGGLLDVAQLSIPAVGACLVVLRTATASLAARADFTLDDIADLRIAVDEASALLLLSAAPGSALKCVFPLSPGFMRGTVARLSQLRPLHTTSARARQQLLGSLPCRTSHSRTSDVARGLRDARWTELRWNA